MTFSGYTDFHLHLQDGRFCGKQERIVNRCRKVGVQRLFVNATYPEDWPLVADLAETYPEVFPFFGIHPWFIPDGDFLRSLEQLVQRIPCGIGEIGLDLWKQGIDRDTQEMIFCKQMELGIKLGRPVTVHCLKAFDWLQQLLKRYTDNVPMLLIHAFGGSMQQMDQLLDLGAFISFSSSVLRPEKTKLRESMRTVPLERLLLESDAPDFLPPREYILQPLVDGAGTDINTPENLPALYRFVAQFRGMDEEDLITHLANNAQRIMDVASK